MVVFSTREFQIRGEFFAIGLCLKVFLTMVVALVRGLSSLLTDSQEIIFDYEYKTQMGVSFSRIRFDAFGGLRV